MNPNSIRVFENNSIYIANLIALLQWYRYVRSVFISKDFPMELFEGLKKNLHVAIEERVRQFGFYCEMLKDSIEKCDNNITCDAQRKEPADRWDEVEAYIRSQVDNKGNLKLMESFLSGLHHSIGLNGKDYIRVIKGLEDPFKEAGTRWLQEIVDLTTEGVLKIVPSLKAKI